MHRDTRPKIYLFAISICDENFSVLPEISIIIPYYSKENTISRAVQSVIAQTFIDWELVIVDDCSPLSLSMLPEWTDYNIRLVRNEKNIGPGPTRQLGMSLCSGTFFAFLDADDWWSDTFLEVSLSRLKEQSDAAATWVRSEIYNKDGTVSIRRYSDYPFTNIQETALQYPRPWQTGGLLWRKSFCGEWGGLSTNQDYRFELSSSAKCNKIVPVSQVLYHVDQTTGKHRTDLVAYAESVRNQYDLHEFVHRDLYPILSLKSRILLFHRIIRAMLKVTEHCEQADIQNYWGKTERMYSVSSLFFRSPFVLKVIHYLLQRTPYRLFF